MSACRPLGVQGGGVGRPSSSDLGKATSPWIADWVVPMNYRNTEMKLDSIVSYFNEAKINLNPVFQRGQVWPLKTRRKLIANMVQGRPIPAIFLYKEEDGAKYSYNILDGKQRLESLILFIANARADLAIQKWNTYFAPGSKTRQSAKYWIQLPEGKKTFANLDQRVVRDFREYAIPTIEITLHDGSDLDEIISLFVDINQQGVKVNRFDVVKAMGANNRLLRSVFDLIAIKQRRGQAAFYKAKSNEFTRVLKTMTIVGTLVDNKAQVDRMWSRLLEIALFLQTGRHRKPVDILKSFISARDQKRQRLSGREIQNLRRPFRFLDLAYRASPLGQSPLATEQTHFYTMVTSLVAGDLFDRFTEDKIRAKLVAFGGILGGQAKAPADVRIGRAIKAYLELSSDRTTDAPRREKRREKFVEVVTAL